MASGVAVDPACIDAVQALIKQRKFRGVTLKITSDLTAVKLEKTYSHGGGSAKDEWNNFTRTLPEDDCRFAVYDFSYEHQGAMKTRVLFLLWSPEYSRVKSKMIYASSQEGVTSKVSGIQRQIQATDPEEISYEAIAKQLVQHTAGY